MKHSYLALALGLLLPPLLSTGCATAPSSGLAAAPADPTRTSAKAEQPAGEAGDEFVCQEIEKTGSHLRQQKICRTKQQVDDAERGARDFVHSIDRASSARQTGN